MGLYDKLTEHRDYYTTDLTLADYIERAKLDDDQRRNLENAMKWRTKAEAEFRQAELEYVKGSQGPNNITNESSNTMTEHKQAENLVSVKNDQGKPRYDLLPVAPMREMAEVLEFGSRKYDSNNWRSMSPVPLSRHYAAVQRHLNQWWAGEDLDPESGMRHLAHAATTLMFIMELSKSRPQSDDRFRDCAPYNEEN